jgi:hypothetical protein
MGIPDFGAISPDRFAARGIAATRLHESAAVRLSSFQKNYNGAIVLLM